MEYLLDLSEVGEEEVDSEESGGEEPFEVSGGANGDLSDSDVEESDPLGGVRGSVTDVSEMVNADVFSREEGEWVEEGFV